MKVSTCVKALCGCDSRAFCILTNYLFSCLEKLQKSGKTLKQVDEQYRKMLKYLVLSHPIDPEEV